MEDSMQLGYFTMPLHPPGSDLAQTMEMDLAQIVALEALGFREAWVGEHFTSEWENIPCPDLFIAQALARTRRIVLGTGVNCLPNHHPLMLAQRIAQLDQMARGRFYWGVGSGGFPGDFQLFEVDGKTGQQRGMTREILDTVIQLWTDPKPGVYESTQRNWRFRIPEPQDDIGLRLHLKPYQRPHPPIAVAGVSSGSETLMLAGERGYIPMSINFVPPRILKTHWDAVATGAARAGRPADRSTWRIARDVYVADTDAQARREALSGTLARDYRDYFLRLLPKLRGFEMLKLDPAMPDSDVTLDYLMENIWIVGSPETVARKVAALGEAVGGFGTLLVIAHEWRPRAAWEHSVTLLKEQVLPRLEARR
jgi:alkanesulfonate monooxygenase SsuD/methylene tetrahydromethanopterin reductase-like flavin-dependent oxidoreductase (luciferase family)